MTSMTLEQKTFWQIEPCIYGNQRSWMVQKVTPEAGRPEWACTATLGTFGTLKAAKAMVAHLKHKPLVIR